MPALSTHVRLQKSTSGTASLPKGPHHPHWRCATLIGHGARAETGGATFGRLGAGLIGLETSSEMHSLSSRHRLDMNIHSSFTVAPIKWTHHRWDLDGLCEQHARGSERGGLPPLNSASCLAGNNGLTELHRQRDKPAADFKGFQAPPDSTHAATTVHPDVAEVQAAAA
eukprot:gnl/MRDRNA2_/MRDRNA2_113738_c0_seq1.p1 gnl/MRDRNA2_/MRDRNA2_113738_c0~~gnl/MRDRNA2_/MRDRNA2_113738_c0_seq1.p1  ORF type:complete len:169 (-),score=26.34 gnl/MRDRNA2_/MRDRNA2_113738_c0_seq1:3-509(-)